MRETFKKYGVLAGMLATVVVLAFVFNLATVQAVEQYGLGLGIAVAVIGVVVVAVVIAAIEYATLERHGDDKASTGEILPDGGSNPPVSTDPLDYDGP